MSKSLTLTIVIPVYNEEHYLKACLDSITAQTVKPDEVIVVDNNSTDKTLQIAEKYPFVKILHENRQHQVFAQATGFNAAKGDIIGRIDGDSILPTDWVKIIKNAFLDKKVVALTGGANPYDVPLKWIGVAVFYSYNYLYSLVAGKQMLFGGNCAIRRIAWQKIKMSVFYRGDIWEDYDMSFCLDLYGQIRYLRHAAVGVSFRSVHKPFLKQVNYQFRAVRTFYFRTNVFRTLVAGILWISLLPVYPLTVIDQWVLNRSAN